MFRDNEESSILWNHRYPGSVFFTFSQPARVFIVKLLGQKCVGNGLNLREHIKRLCQQNIVINFLNVAVIAAIWVI
ncbi:protein of unknown function [Xenorhabdus poinarii G6]|uniref:Uncharacterized protein n=1 Tax=Xenorhabdus poinarii G6 TaxID=1354304 RepID=A0A068R249_9GAMM|nr:protein of unknown function [Xenorhabdus poinarii G6]